MVFMIPVLRFGGQPGDDRPPPWHLKEPIDYNYFYLSNTKGHEISEAYAVSPFAQTVLETEDRGVLEADQQQPLYHPSKKILTGRASWIS
jgi:hypothetical protein